MTSGLAWARHTFREAARNIWRNKSPACAFVLILGVGLGFAVSLLGLSAALDRPITAHEPERLIAVSVADNSGRSRSLPAPLRDRLLDHALLRNSAGYTQGPLLEAVVDGRSLDVTSAIIDGEFFDVLGLAPVMGTAAVRDETSVVVGHGFWQRGLGADPAVLGRTIHVDQVPLTVTGVMPPKAGLQVDSATDIFLSAAALGKVIGRRPPAGIRATHVLARIPQDSSIAIVRKELTEAWPAITAGLPPSDGGGTRVVTESIQSGFSILRTRHAKQAAILLWLSIGLLAVATITALGLAYLRLTARSSDLIVRLALGATRWRIAAMTVAESTLLALCAAVIAIPFAAAANQMLLTMLWIGTVPPTLSVSPDGRLVAAAVGFAIAVGLISGLPALRHAGRRHPLHGIGRALVFQRTGRVLVAVHVSLTLGLFAGSILLVRSLVALQNVDRGFRTERIGFGRLVASTPASYRNLDSERYYQTLLAEVSRVRGIESTALSRAFPTVLLDRVDVRGQSGDAGLSVTRQQISPRVFHTLSIPFLLGRDFQDGDTAKSPPVAILSESLATHLFGAPDRALNQRIQIDTPAGAQMREVVGIATNVAFGDPKAPERRAVFVPAFQTPQFLAPILLFKTSRPINETIADVDAIIRDSGRERAPRLMSLQEYEGVLVLPERLLGRLAAVFAIGAGILMVAAVAVFFSFSVHQRQREIGLRLALGASPQKIQRTLMTSAVKLTCIGAALGLPLAYAAGRLVDAVLYGVGSNDAVSLALAAVAIMVLAVTGSWGPSIKASRTDPIQALRSVDSGW